MTADDLEIFITQSLDGLLSPEEQAALDAELARNPAARQLREEYLSLDRVLKNAPLPTLNEGRLSRQISLAIADRQMPRPVYIFPIWARWAAGIAAAACVALIAGIWMRPPAQKPMAANMPAGLTQVAIMNAGAPINSRPIGGISIGPQPGMDKTDLAAREALTASHSTVAIDSAAPLAQDSDRPLY
jgi:hypothetical protein